MGIEKKPTDEGFSSHYFKEKQTRLVVGKAFFGCAYRRGMMKSLFYLPHWTDFKLLAMLKLISLALSLNTYNNNSAHFQIKNIREAMGEQASSLSSPTLCVT